MLKKVVVYYDELNKPIQIVELKEFTSTKDLLDFQTLCETNKKAYDKRKQEALEKERVEKERLLNRVKLLEEENISLKGEIAYLKGEVDELEDTTDELKDQVSEIAEEQVSETTEEQGGNE